MSITAACPEMKKVQLLLDLIMPENRDAAIIERSARVHPLTEEESC
jgi:hypothetical protein